MQSACKRLSQTELLMAARVCVLLFFHLLRDDIWPFTNEPSKWPRAEQHYKVNNGVITALYGIHICFCWFSLYYLIAPRYLNATELYLAIGVKAGLFEINVTLTHMDIHIHIHTHVLMKLWVNVMDLWCVLCNKVPCICKYEISEALQFWLSSLKFYFYLREKHVLWLDISSIFRR